MSVEGTFLVGGVVLSKTYRNLKVHEKIAVGISPCLGDKGASRLFPVLPLLAILVPGRYSANGGS